MGDVRYFSKSLSLCLVWPCIGGAAAYTVYRVQYRLGVCVILVPCTAILLGTLRLSEPAMIECVKWLNLGRPPLWFTYENVRTAFLATET